MELESSHIVCACCRRQFCGRFVSSFISVPAVSNTNRLNCVPVTGSSALPVIFSTARNEVVATQSSVGSLWLLFDPGRHLLQLGHASSIVPCPPPLHSPTPLPSTSPQWPHLPRQTYGMTTFTVTI